MYWAKIWCNYAKRCTHCTTVLALTVGANFVCHVSKICHEQHVQILMKLNAAHLQAERPKASTTSPHLSLPFHHLNKQQFMCFIRDFLLVREYKYLAEIKPLKCSCSALFNASLTANSRDGNVELPSSAGSSALSEAVWGLLCLDFIFSILHEENGKVD